MPVITTKTTVAAGNTSAWSDTDGLNNIAVGVSGNDYHVEFNMGSDIIYTNAGKDHANEVIVVAKANQIRVVNRGDEDLDFEVFA